MASFVKSKAPIFNSHIKTLLAPKSKVREGHGIEASLLSILMPVIFSQIPTLVEKETTIRQFEVEDQDALTKYLYQSVVRRRECNMEPFLNNLRKLTLENPPENHVKV